MKLGAKNIILDETGLNVINFSTVTKVLKKKETILGNLECNEMLYVLNYALWDVAFKGRS